MSQMDSFSSFRSISRPFGKITYLFVPLKLFLFSLGSLWVSRETGNIMLMQSLGDKQRVWYFPKWPIYHKQYCVSLLTQILQPVLFDNISSPKKKDTATSFWFWTNNDAALCVSCIGALLLVPSIVNNNLKNKVKWWVGEGVMEIISRKRN